MSIARKILIGYIAISTITIVVAAYALSSLERLNRINANIIEVDTPGLKVSEQMYEALLAQDNYGRRYALMKSPEMLRLYREKDDEFVRLAKSMRDLHGTEELPINALIVLHEGYSDIFREWFENLPSPSSAPGKEYDTAIRQKQEELMSLIGELKSSFQKARDKKILQISQVGNKAFSVTVALCGLGILTGMGAAALIIRNIAHSVGKLKLATGMVARGKFDNLPVIDSEDELGELSLAFRNMVARLRRLEEMYLDASPLTHLPGGVAIENILKKRITAQHPFSFCLIDLDNFKAFNDCYGYARGNDLILATAQIIANAIKVQGTEEDFIGHIGGDDFAVITTPERHSEICEKIVEEFDRAAPGFYELADQNRGYITGKTRDGSEVTYPFVSVSIAVVTNKIRTLSSHLQVGEIAAELKKYVKNIPGSVYAVDRRKKDL